MPILVNGSDAENWIRTPQGGGPVGYDAVTVAVTVWPIVAGFGDTLNVTASEMPAVSSIINRIAGSMKKNAFPLLVISPPQNEYGIAAVSTSISKSSSLFDWEYTLSITFRYVPRTATEGLTYPFKKFFMA
jgi:hypothetical protein